MTHAAIHNDIVNLTVKAVEISCSSTFVCLLKHILTLSAYHHFVEVFHDQN